MEVESFTYDLYVLCGERSRTIVDAFLQRYTVGMSPGQDEYWVPQFSEHQRMRFVDERGLIQYLLDHPDVDYNLYYALPKGSNLERLAAMMFFTKDGHLIVGVTERAVTADELWHRLDEMGRTMNAKYGYVDVERPPPDSADKFISVARNTADLPAFADEE